MTKSRPSQHLGSEFFNPFPRYLQIRNILMRRFSDGFAAGDRFPGEHQLCNEFGVSRETVREALRGLESDGFIARHRGRGTFVVRLPDRAQDERLTGLVEDFTDLRLDTNANVVRAGVETPPVRIARALHLDTGDRLFRILRLRRVDGKPFASNARRALSHGRSGGRTMFFEGYFRADRYYYTVQLNRGSSKPILSTSPGDARTKRSRSASSRR